MGPIKMKDFIEGRCPYKGCELNEEGSCISDNKDFLSRRMVDILEDGNTEGNFQCDGSIFSDGMCKQCGEELLENRECMGEFWGAPAYETIYHCKNCE